MRLVLVLGMLAIAGCFAEEAGSAEAGGSSTSEATMTDAGSATSASSVGSSADATSSVDSTDDATSSVDDSGTTGPCVDDACVVARSCADLPDGTPGGLQLIDPDGPGGRAAFEVLCEMDRSGGGWTLVLVSSDDGQHTWTFDNAALWTNGATLGAPSEADRDLKSPAATSVPFTDLLFVHQPSGVFAAYADVVGTAVPFTGFMTTVSASPVCGPGPGQGISMTDGTLATGTEPTPVLWETALYFNRGDLDGAQGSCSDLASAFNDATWGPSWNAWVFGDPAGDNDFNDPFAASLGPANPGCSTGCMPSFGGTEFNARGFGAAIGATPLLTPANDAAHYIQMYVR